MLIIRYGIGAVMVIAGLVMLIVSPSGLGVEGFAMAVGGGLSVLLINFLFRLGVEGDRERDKEEEARDASKRRCRRQGCSSPLQLMARPLPAQ